jgi:HlyD family secretion protein
LRETNDKIGEFVERKVTAEDQLRRVDIRAAGRHGAAIHGPYRGGVITAGDAIADDRAAGEDLSVEAKVNPQDIDKLQIGRRRCCGCRPSTSAPRPN